MCASLSNIYVPFFGLTVLMSATSTALQTRDFLDMERIAAHGLAAALACICKVSITIYECAEGQREGN